MSTPIQNNALSRFVRKLLTRKASTKRRKSATRLRVDGLEERAMMAAALDVSFNYADRVLVVSDTPEDDFIQIFNDGGQISVTGNEIVVTNGHEVYSVSSLPIGEIDHAHIHSLSGTDTIDVAVNDVTPDIALNVWHNGNLISTADPSDHPGVLTVTFNYADKVLRVNGTEESEYIQIFNNSGQISVTGYDILVTNGGDVYSVSSLPISDIRYTNIRSGIGEDYIDVAELDVTPAIALNVAVDGVMNGFAYRGENSVLENAYFSLRTDQLIGLGEYLGESVTADMQVASAAFERGMLVARAGSAVYTLTGPIYQKYVETLNRGVSLGALVHSGYSTYGNGANYAVFENGAIYAWDYGVFEVHGAIWTRYADLRWEWGLGYPMSDVIDDGVGQISHFKDSAIASHSSAGTHHVYGAIYKRWAELGFGRSFLGYPTSPETDIPNRPGERYQLFQTGGLYWLGQGQPIEVHGSIFAKYQALGGVAAYGVPVENEQDVPGGKVSHFTGGGSIYYKWNAPEAYEVHGAIRERWHVLNGLGGLGFPISDETAATGNAGDAYKYSRFERGTLVWKNSTSQTFEALGLINAKWWALGAFAGLPGSVRLGAPTESENVTGDRNGKYAHFEGGSIFYKNGAMQAFEIHGAIRDNWARAGWERSAWGYPIADEQSWPSRTTIRYSDFEHGKLFFALKYDPFDSGAAYPSLSDISQFDSNTCVILSTLAGLAKTQGSLLASRIRHLPGTNLYDVYLPGANKWQRVVFDGTFGDNDPIPVLNATQSAKFWPILMQRAALEYYEVNWHDLDSKTWNNRSDFADTEGILELFTGLDSYVSWDGDLDTPDHLRSFLFAGDLLVAGTKKDTNVSWLAGSTGERHQFLINKVEDVGGQWFVELYNPWGFDGQDNNGNVITKPGDPNANDGFIRLTWAEFTTYFIEYGRATLN